MKSSLILTMMLAASQLFAQQFTKQAALETVKTDGLSAIAIPPTVRSYSQADLADLRLFDSKNIEVPYYIYQDNKQFSSVDFEGFPMISKNIIQGKSTTIIIENTANTAIDQIVLNIANSKLVKYCDILGSNNQQQWFGLIQDHSLGNLENVNRTDVFVNISLPLSSYRYLKLQIKDSYSAPINVLKVGGYKLSLFSSKLIPLEAKSVITKTNSEEKRTRILVSFPAPQILDKVEFQISLPNLFKRNARIMVNRTIETKHNKQEQELVTLYEFELNSKGTISFDLPSLFEKELIIEIDNEDNPPLKIDKVIFSQLPLYIVADLKAKEHYVLKTGDGILNTPNYDIENFKQNSLASLPNIQLSQLITIEDVTLKENNNTSFWQQKWFLWACIIIAGLIILYFSTALLKDMKKKDV